MKKIRKITYKHTNRLLTLILFLSLVFVALSTVNAVSAADSSTIYVNDSGGNDVNDGLTWEFAKKSIKSAVETVTEGGTVNIADGTYRGENNTNINIDKNMTIQGQSREGTIINGTDSEWIFYIPSGKNVTIANLTLANGTETAVGGAISNYGTLTVNNCIFTGNNVTRPMGDGFGGAIYNEGNLTVTGSTFTDNSANYGGAISNGYYNGGTLTVNGCTFTGNYATSSGGAIYNPGTLTIINSSFTGNTAYDGGAIYNGGTLTITGSAFTSNKADRDGGAIDNQWSSSLNVTNSIFTDNTAYEGGAIENKNKGILKIVDSTFINNAADYYGGAISNYGDLTITNGTFTGNKADYGGAISNYGGTLTATDSNFTDNTASSYGGAIDNEYNGNLTVETSTFTDNKAGAGGAIYNQGTSTIKGSTFKNNIANYGGAIYTDWNSNLTITDSTFTDNTANGDGGAISSHSKLTVTSSTFTGNKAADDGGAIYHASNNMTVTGCNFDHNTANSDGGAIYCWIGYEDNYVVIAKYSRFVGNKVGNSLQDISIYEGALDARYNWWGNNNGPETGRIAGRGSHTTANVISYTPWLVLNINADPSTIDAGKTSKITANVYMDSAGGDHSADAAQFFSGPEVTFTTDLGNVGSKSVTVPWTLGSAFAILRGDEGPGLANLAAGDVQTVQRLINILQVSNSVGPGNSDDPEDPVDQTENSTTTVNAASKTIKMQETGLPLAGLIIAVLMLFGGLATSKR